MRLLLAAIFAATCSAQWLSPTSLGQNQSGPPDSLYREVLETLCPGEVVFDGQNRGCHVCPPDTMDAGRRQEAQLFLAISGHLKSPDSEDVLAVVYGCEPHANHYIDIFVLTRQASGWETAKADDGMAGSCRKIANQEGQDGLLCYGADMFSGVGLGTLSFGYVSGSPTPILSTVAMALPCGFHNAPMMVANSNITGVRLTPQANRLQLLTVRATCSRGRSVCRHSQDVAKHPVREFVLDFQFDGMTFQVTPGSAAALKQYEACSTLDSN